MGKGWACPPHKLALGWGSGRFFFPRWQSRSCVLCSQVGLGLCSLGVHPCSLRVLPAGWEGIWQGTNLGEPFWEIHLSLTCLGLLFPAVLDP